eukprot:EG_transcript_20994
MVLNVFCVVSIVILNKQLYSKPYEFRFGSTLVCIHFVVTGLLTALTAQLGVFKVKGLPFVELLKLSAAQVGSVAFVNFSLLYNSVGLYQVLKLLNIPVICVMEYVWLQISYSTQLKVSLFVILLGVGMATVTEIEFSLVGFIHGFLATIATGLYQIMCGTKQKEYGIDAMQLLHKQAPVTAAMLGLLALLFDDIPALCHYPFHRGVVLLILFTGLVAFGVNLTVFLIIGKTSPVTYQVVGHFKTCAVIFFGFVWLHQPFDTTNLIGMSVAFLGMVFYTLIKQSEATAKAAAKAAELQAALDREAQGRE